MFLKQNAESYFKADNQYFNTNLFPVYVATSIHGNKRGDGSGGF